MKKFKLKRLNPMPDQPCGECKFYDPVHDITPKLSEGWCRVDKYTAFVLSEETCDKWQLK
tara:strand:+ start:441 stop:620 length:180 start_codon:yes stop_codon:yes gene_type:complete